jgi:hypothetical protein
MRRVWKTAAALAVAIALAVPAGGCASASAAQSGQLLGSWFDDVSGSQYRFVSDTVVVVPRQAAWGGNAQTYSLTDGRLEIVSGTERRVSMVAALTSDRLVLADPITGEQQVLLRHAERTAFAKGLAEGAVNAAKDAGSITAIPEIAWVAKKPEGDHADWTSWAPSTLDAYAAAWDWTTIERAKGVPVRTSGGGSDMGFAFTMQRVPPTPEELAAALADPPASVATSSVEPTAGLSRIDVGYSASKDDYPAGTLVYLPGGLVYSLGSGYAIPVGLDAATRSFVPLTHH